MANPTLEDLMSPRFQIEQAKYENARSARIMAYQFARDLYDYKGKDVAEIVSKFLEISDLLTPKIQADLDKTLMILEASHGGKS